MTVNRTVEHLPKGGLLVTERYQPISLTPEGMELARSCAMRHAIVFNFLRAIGVGERTAAADAEGMEHHVSSVTLERFRRLARDGGYEVHID